MKTRKKMENRTGGFTLVELIVVLVILAILIALLVPALTGYIDKAREKKVYGELKLIATAATTAFSEVYAERGEGWAEDQQIFYKNPLGDSEVDKAFKAIFEDLIGDDIDYDRIIQINIMGAKNMGILYEVNGTQYYYRKDDGKLTMGKYTP